MAARATLSVLVSPALARALKGKRRSKSAAAIGKVLRENAASLQPLDFAPSEDDGATYLTVVVEGRADLVRLTTLLKDIDGVRAAFVKPATALP